MYNYFNSQDPTNPNTCFFLSNSDGLQKQMESCEHCSTGPAQCNVGQPCQVALVTNGSGIQDFPFLAEEGPTSLTLVAGEKDCYVDFDILAIGGGGNNVFGSKAGAGSGFIESATGRLSTTSPVAEVLAGIPGQLSRVEVGAELVVEAAPGGDPDEEGGGDGYCGGGGVSSAPYPFPGGPPHGGSNGGDGEDGDRQPGGKGSGLDLGQFAIEGFQLAPGDGGEATNGYGGGGGGVVVNDMKPGGNNNNGQGYGGGGANGYMGEPGCVLFAEITTI